MITLAIGQMFYAYFFKARAFGGDNGMSGTPRFDLSPLGLETGDPAVFSALMLVIAGAVYVALLLLVRSPFGMMLTAIHQNENRLASLGCPVFRYKLAAFGLGGAIAGLAGALMAQHTGFVSPDLAFWTLSGEALIIVILGGSGSLVGAAGGAAVFVLLRDHLSDGAFWRGPPPARGHRQPLAARDGPVLHRGRAAGEGRALRAPVLGRGTRALGLAADAEAKAT